MKTTMPTSTISYNSGGFLKLKLDELLKAKVIQFYAFIEHVPEEDEKKKHKHLYIEPAKSVQTEELRDELREYVEETPDKPLGCMPFGKSKFGDWYLYAIHDEAYLLVRVNAQSINLQGVLIRRVHAPPKLPDRDPAENTGELSARYRLR